MADGTTKQRYWLLFSDAPDGPFDRAQIRAKLSAGEITWQTQACVVGDSTWSPLIKTPGVGPATPVCSEAVQVGSPVPDKEPPEFLPAIPPPQSAAHPPAPVSLTTTTTASRARWRWWQTALVLLVMGVGGWFAYSWVQPLTPREVCDRFNGAKTAEEAKKYCTLNLHLALEAMYKQQQPTDPNDEFEYTQEGDAPPAVGGHYVGVRWQFYFAEERRRMQIDGVIHLIQSNGWKVEDLYILSVDHQNLPQPLSLARDYPLLLAPAAGGGGQAALASSQPPAATKATAEAKGWYDDPQVQRGLGRSLPSVLRVFFSSGGAKAVGAFLLAAIIVVLRFGKGLLEWLAKGERK